jgi:CHAT domain-containing protein
LDDRVELILRLPRQQALYHPPATQVSKPEIEAILDRLYSTLQEDGAYEEVQTDGQTLYNWLIEPLKTPLEQNQIQTLVFVLDGAFRKIPMSALYDGEQYLVENYTISLIPGLQLRDPEPLRRGEMKVLAASLTDPPENVPGFAKLANVQKEMEEIKETGISVTEISEEKFTMANFSQKLLNTSFDVVHLATHGQFGSTPENTFLITAEGTLNIDEFEQLFRNQRQTGEQAIQLLIMSACQTATGNEQEILGLAGMTVQAGASSAIGSLWDLDDEAGALFTEAFYRYLGQPNISRAEALRRAQVALLDNENYDHPRYWAPYILVGLWL